MPFQFAQFIVPYPSGGNRQAERRESQGAAKPRLCEFPGLAEKPWPNARESRTLPDSNKLCAPGQLRTIPALYLGR